MKRYISLWLVCLLAVFSMTARAQEGIETKARPDYPALPFTLKYTAPEGAASFLLSADGKLLPAFSTTVHAGTQVTLTTAPAAGYRMAFGYPKAYRTDATSTTVPVTPVSGCDNTYTFTMPGYPATVEVRYEKIPYAVSFATPANGTLALDTIGTKLTTGAELIPGKLVTVTVSPAAGYQMASGYPKAYRTDAPATPVTLTAVSGSDNTAFTFIVPDYPVTVEAKYEKIPYAVSFAAPANGSLALSAAGAPLASGAKIAPDTKVTLTATPAKGYQMASGYPKVYRTDAPATTVPVMRIGISKDYTFAMPEFPVTVEVKYEKIAYTVFIREAFNGSLALDTAGTKLASGTKLIPGTQVTVTAAPAEGYQMISGCPRVKPYSGPEAPLQATPVDGRDNTYTFTMPDYPVEVEVKYEKIPQAVTFADPANGTLALSVNGNPLTSGDKLALFKEVKITATPDEGYQMVFGSLKVFGNDETGKEIIVPLEKGNGVTCFLMPAFEVKVEVEFEEIPKAKSSETRLSSLSYQVGGETEKPIPGFLASTIAYDVVLPSTTSQSAILTLSGQPVDTEATVVPTAATVQLVDGQAKATLVVTAEDGQAKRTYEVNFTVAPQPVCYVTIQQPEGGTISLSYKENKEQIVNPGDAESVGTVLSLGHTALPNHVLCTYKMYVNGTIQGTAVSEYTVSGDNLKITAQFNPQSTVPPEEIATIGTPAVPKEKEGQDMNVPTDDNPIVIIPDAVSLPSDTELSSLRLVKEDIEDSEKKAEIEEKAEAAAQDAGIAPDAPKIVMEVTLVKVTTKISGDNETTTTAVTPVQPSDIVTVRIPYPEGVRKDQHDIVIIHLRSDGVVDVYSEAKDNLILKEDYMEISVTSFSPFVVSYTDKPDKPEYPDQPDTPDTPDTPTSNASVEGGMAVWTSANALHIRADRPAEAWVVGLSGASRARFAVVPGETRYALPAGVYLVRIADQTYKVRIRN